MNPGTQSTRTAVELLTLWLEPGSAARANSAAHIERLMTERGDDGTAEVVAGLLNLNMFILRDLAKERGATTTDEINEACGTYLRQMSPKLPE